MRAAWMVGLTVIALATAACAGQAASTVSPRPSASLAANGQRPPVSPTPTAASASAVPSSPSPTPGGPAPYAAEDGDIAAGTYEATHFKFPFTAEINTDLGIRDAHDGPRLVYIAQDKNAPVNADEEFNAMLLLRVFDPADQRTLASLGGDVYDWFVHHPRFKVVPSSKDVFEVDGHPARQVDLLPADPVECGPFHINLDCVLVGYGPEGDEPFAVFDGSRLRIVVVDHDGTPILFAYQATDDARYAERSSVFDHWVRSVDFR
jgi:hypothetical protein